MNIPSNNSTAAAVAAAPVTAVTAIPFESRDEDDTGSACSSNSSRSSNSYASGKVAASSASAVGLEKGFVPDIQTALETLHVDQVGFIACNLFHPRYVALAQLVFQVILPSDRPLIVVYADHPWWGV